VIYWVGPEDVGGMSKITTFFLDVGGVLGTNGWDHKSRELAAKTFDLDYAEMAHRHDLSFGAYEEGKLTLDSYLDRVVFYRPRPFSREDFRSFMLSQSQPDPAMLSLIADLKEKYRLRVVITSNEGRELALHRIPLFGLDVLADYFIFSCFIHIRKPDPSFYHMALDMNHVAPQEVVYIDDREMFVEVARGLGIHGVWQTSIETTRAALSDLGLTTGSAKGKGL
jgi:putative hydrolase of the HAD superfamily